MTPKAHIVEQLLDFLVMTHKPHKRAVVVMWREFMNEYHLNLSPDHPIWIRDGAESHQHWKQYGPRVLFRLREKYKTTNVKITGLIRALVPHGDYPDRDRRITQDKQRYIDCLCGPHAQCAGFVAFPRGSELDHVLITESHKRRCKAATSGLVNSKKAIDRAEDYKVLSHPIHTEIVREMQPRLREAFEDHYPLFPLELADGVALEPPGKESTQ